MVLDEERRVHKSRKKNTPLKTFGGVQLGQLWGEQLDAGLLQPGIPSEVFFSPTGRP